MGCFLRDWWTLTCVGRVSEIMWFWARSLVFFVRFFLVFLGVLICGDEGAHEVGDGGNEGDGEEEEEDHF